MKLEGKNTLFRFFMLKPFRVFRSLQGSQTCCHGIPGTLVLYKCCLFHRSPGCHTSPSLVQEPPWVSSALGQLLSLPCPSCCVLVGIWSLCGAPTWSRGLHPGRRSHGLQVRPAKSHFPVWNDLVSGRIVRGRNSLFCLLPTEDLCSWLPHLCRHFYFLNFIDVRLIYNIVLISSVQQSGSRIHICVYIYIYKFFSIFFSIIVCHRILNVVPCAVQ